MTGNYQEEKTGIVAGIKKFMRSDGPGIRSVVFLKGCGLRCLWCSSPQTWRLAPQVIFLKNKCIACGKCGTICETGAIDPSGVHRVDYAKCTACGKCVALCAPQALRFDGKKMSVYEVLDEVMKDADYYKKTGGGVTLSGGEASMQADFAVEILKACKENGIHTALETCGFAAWEDLKKLLVWTDAVFFDVKHMDADEHRKLTGHGNERILENLMKTAREGRSTVAVNVPLIPGLNDSRENLAATARLMMDLKLKKVRVLPFHKLGKHEYEELGISYGADYLKPASRHALDEAKAFFEEQGLAVADD